MTESRTGDRRANVSRATLLHHLHRAAYRKRLAHLLNDSPNELYHRAQLHLVIWLLNGMIPDSELMHEVGRAMAEADRAYAGDSSPWARVLGMPEGPVPDATSEA